MVLLTLTVEPRLQLLLILTMQFFLLSFHTNQKHKMYHFKSSRGKTHWVFHMANVRALFGVGSISATDGENCAE